MKISQFSKLYLSPNLVLSLNEIIEFEIKI